jgi:hypothetical protein
MLFDRVRMGVYGNVLSFVAGNRSMGQANELELDHGAKKNLHHGVHHTRAERSAACPSQSHKSSCRGLHP